MNIKSIDLILECDAEWFKKAKFLPPSKVSEIFAFYSLIKCSSDILTVSGLSSILQKIDWCLRVGGVIEIDCTEDYCEHGFWRRSASQMQYAFGRIFKDGYSLISRNEGKLTFKKNKVGRVYKSDFSGGITFGFISNGENIERLAKILDLLSSELAIPIEIIICGPIGKLQSLQSEDKKIIFIEDVESDDIRAPINKKKSQIIELAGKENLVLAHDRIFFDREWFSRLKSFGNNFDFYNCRHCDWSAYPDEIRVNGDWTYFLSPITGFGAIPRSGTCPYDHNNPNFYINGGVYFGKTEAFRLIGWPDYFHWGDLEDVHFSRLLELSGYVVQLDFSNRFFTTTKRLGRYYEKSRLSKITLFLYKEILRLRFLIKYKSTDVD